MAKKEYRQSLRCLFGVHKWVFRGRTRGRNAVEMHRCLDCAQWRERPYRPYRREALKKFAGRV